MITAESNVYLQKIKKTIKLDIESIGAPILQKTAEKTFFDIQLNPLTFLLHSNGLLI